MNTKFFAGALAEIYQIKMRRPSALRRASTIPHFNVALKGIAIIPYLINRNGVSG